MVMEKRTKKNKEKKRSRDAYAIPVKSDATEDDLEIQLKLTTELIKKKVKISDDLESSIDEDANQIYFVKSEQTETVTMQEPKELLEPKQQDAPSPPKSEPIPIKSEPSKNLNSKRGGKDWRKKEL